MPKNVPARRPRAAADHRRLAAIKRVLPPGEKSAGTRGLMLDAALHLFAERGYGGASVRDIVEICGVQPSTLYAHFVSKEEVLAELCRIGHEAFHACVQAAVLAAPPDPREQIAAYVRAQVGFHVRYSVLAVVCNSEMHMLSPLLVAPILEVRKRSESLLASIVQRGTKAGVFKVPHAWLATAMIGSACLRVANWYTPAFELAPERVADIYAQYALRVLDGEGP